MNGQCLGCRLESVAEVAEQVTPWEEERNAMKVRVHWSFTLVAAQQKLKKEGLPLNRKLTTHQGGGSGGKKLGMGIPPP